MKLFSLGNHLTPYLMGTSIVLAGTLALESGNMLQPEHEKPAPGKAAVNSIERVNYSAPGLAAFSEITERPLFIEGRVPPPEPKNAPKAVATSKLRLQLEGVAITPESSVAVLRDLSTNKMLHLAKGMKHQGWELTAITDNVATFTRGEQNLEITLNKDRK